MEGVTPGCHSEKRALPYGSALNLLVCPQSNSHPWTQNLKTGQNKQDLRYEQLK